MYIKVTPCSVAGSHTTKPMSFQGMNIDIADFGKFSHRAAFRGSSKAEERIGSCLVLTTGRNHAYRLIYWTETFIP